MQICWDVLSSLIQIEFPGEGKDTNQIGDSKQNDSWTNKLHLQSWLNFRFCLNFHDVSRESTDDNAH